MSVDRLSGGVIIIALFGAFVAPELNAQFLSSYFVTDYETLEWLFDTGQIDSDEFDRWSEFFTDSIQESTTDLHTVEGAEMPTIKATGIENPTRDATASFRMYHRGCDSEPYRRIIRMSYSDKPGFYGSLIAESSANQEIYLRSRSIGWRDDNMGIEVGGVDPVWCGGLVAGRHPIFLTDRDLGMSMLHSQRDRFNGILIERRLDDFTVSTATSYDRDRLFTAAINGGRIRYLAGGQSIDIALIDGKIRNRENGRSTNVQVIGTGLEAEVRNVSVRFDLAVDRGGKAAYLARISNVGDQHRVYVWRYDTMFRNPFGAGRANTDTREVRIDDIGLSYRSRYAGETGVQTRSEFPLSNSQNLIVESNWWKTGGSEKFRLRGTYTNTFASTGRFKLILLAGDDNIRTEGYDIWSVAASCGTNLPSRHRLSLTGRVKSARIGARRKRLYWIDARWSANSCCHSSHFMIRWFDPDQKSARDHYLLCSVKESFVLGAGLHLSLAASTRFGPDQQAIDKTRITLESTWRL
ncbi:MAG: hypothetical protein ABIK83_12225 [Candidatus Zixiibacteriota bacterium]